jgi:predicted 2-oxoglutarate/Fe(II)-dependent dioxygenase YbiX/peroxiredoxin
MNAPLAPPLPPLAPLSVGEFAPWFSAPSPTNPNYNFSTAAGRYVLLALLPAPGDARDRAVAAFEAHANLFDDHKLTCFMVLRDAGSIAIAKNRPRGLRWLFDAEGKVSRLYGALTPDGSEAPFWLLLDPLLRVLSRAPMGEEARIFDELARLPAVADHAGVPLYAPVLIAPRVFEPDMCKRLIAYYEADGGAPSGVMRDVDGKTVGVLDDFKRRSDASVTDADLRQQVLVRLRRRLLPEIKRVYQFEATRLERYMVACYDAAEGGYFRPHRDDETLGTAHRRFAVSINLNAEAFEGGDLRFPEFGPRTYRPPTGGAVVFCCSLQHEATPVTKGRRYAFLPFLYDEAGACIREENLQYFAPKPE